jgi:mercuric ion transport protein
MFKVGIFGSIVAAVCCLTPLLVWLLPAFGLAGWLTWIDFPIFGVLIFFLVLTGYRLVRRKRVTQALAADKS